MPPPSYVANDSSTFCSRDPRMKAGTCMVYTEQIPFFSFSILNDGALTPNPHSGHTQQSLYVRSHTIPNFSTDDKFCLMPLLLLPVFHLAPSGQLWSLVYLCVLKGPFMVHFTSLSLVFWLRWLPLAPRVLILSFCPLRAAG